RGGAAAAVFLVGATGAIILTVAVPFVRDVALTFTVLLVGASQTIVPSVAIPIVRDVAFTDFIRAIGTIVDHVAHLVDLDFARDTAKLLVRAIGAVRLHIADPRGRDVTGGTIGLVLSPAALLDAV